MKKYITYAKTNDRILPYEEPHRKLARRAAGEGIVLLKNDDSLPIQPGKIALYGAGARHTIKGGTGSGEVNERYSISICEGLQNAGFEITTGRWLDDYDSLFHEELSKLEATIKSEMKEALLHLNFSSYMSIFLRSFLYPIGRPITEHDVSESQTDTCVYVIARQSGEGADRRLEKNEFHLTDLERQNLRFCADHYRNTILVLNTGASMAIDFLEDIPKIHGIIYFCQQGSAGGSALADILTGAVTPSGKLTDTWLLTYDSVPYGKNFSYLNGDLEDEDYLEDIYVGYRFYNTFHLKYAFPFGYGLSYTQFSIDYQTISRNGLTISVTALVTNIGDTWSGKEVVQLYASCPHGRLPKESQRLCAFAKTSLLAPGKSETVTLTFPMSYLTSYDERTASSVLEAGQYLLRIGSDSAHTRLCAMLELPDEICFSVHLNVCPPTRYLSVLTPEEGLADAIPADQIHELIDEQAAARSLFDNLAELDCITIERDEIAPVFYNYRPLPVCPDKELAAELKTFSVRERIDLVIGAGIKDMLMNSSYVKVPGAAGNTTSQFADRGIPNLVLADGPAGLRIQRRSTIDRNGTAKMVDMQFEMMKHFPDFARRLLCGNPDREPVFYQFTTAFPVATSLAQTWNTSLAEEVGYAIGEEMKEYGVTFWLAPALNIHRNPLCGRNYEYYSEDPVISGKMAAAVTRGVQFHEGCFAVLKHFAANNQEDNRDHVSSNITERALREIYLKGFEIAVREGYPKGLMTSYNKINDVYTSNSYDLLTRVLRQEWGFDGLVMTDWTATGKGKSDPALCLEAGNDLLMPGSAYDKKEIMNALKEHTLSGKDLNRCAARVLRAILEGRAD
ncbi:MAG: glycoside hydrolase family 3 C-terminal domain-containing protein [Lachnospiraceae bacterium]|nr:glycoside hydrolase family 3 C-terminal domain-containing protein [Lachnospiraceae bacterium]